MSQVWMSREMSLVVKSEVKRRHLGYLDVYDIKMHVK